jgi:hypothetical protein
MAGVEQCWHCGGGLTCMHCKPVDNPKQALRIAELETALRPFGDAYRFTESINSNFMREQFLASMTVSGKFSTDDLKRAAELTATR